METLYSALQDEIHTFEEHVRCCRKSFDLHTLYKVLLLLSQSQSGELTSLEQLKRVVQGRDWAGQGRVTRTASNESCDLPGYIYWLSSYLGYLKSLKETFDAKVVFPLCEHLYANDALGVGAERWADSGPHSVTSIADIAKELFAVRRKWALLLNGSVIDEHVFSHQSLQDLQGFADIGPFFKVLRLVPDIFHKSLATADLARQWVSVHGSRYSIRQPSEPGQESESQRRTRLAPDIFHKSLATADLARQWVSVYGSRYSIRRPSEPGQESESQRRTRLAPDNSATGIRGFSGGQLLPRPKRSSCSTHDGRGSAMRTKLRESREELMFLLWRAERASMLETQLHEITQHICSLQLEQLDRRKQLDFFQQRLEQEDWDMPGSIRLLSSKWQATLRQGEELGRCLALEEYRKSILQSDWLLELELRPLLIRQIDTLQQLCWELEQSLQARDQAPLEPLPPASGTDSASLCDSGPSSTISPTNND